jgi:hypothetical protein
MVVVRNAWMRKGQGIPQAYARRLPLAIIRKSSLTQHIFATLDFTDADENGWGNQVAADQGQPKRLHRHTPAQGFQSKIATGRGVRRVLPDRDGPAFLKCCPGDVFSG